MERSIWPGTLQARVPTHPLSGCAVADRYMPPRPSPTIGGNLAVPRFFPTPGGGGPALVLLPWLPALLKRRGFEVLNDDLLMT